MRLVQAENPVAMRDTVKASGADFVTSVSGERHIYEAKLYRSLRVPPSWITSAILRLSATLAQFPGARGTLMVSSIVDVQSSHTVDQIRIVDIRELLRLAERHTALAEELGEIFAEATNLSLYSVLSEPLERPVPGSTRVDVAAALTEGGKDRKEGERLCKALRSIPHSDRTRKHERAVEQALRFIFKDQLGKWERQLVQRDELRPDLVAKIQFDAQPFWQELVRDFRTRFVCFDSKNYKDEVTQATVYSTEKYLHSHARRSVALIVSRVGADAGARRAMEGALRESGRIISWLTDDDICAMLNAKDNGDDVHEILSDRIDEMLMRVNR
jgi:hypothetical protein